MTADLGPAFVQDFDGDFGETYGKLDLDVGIRAGVGIGYMLHSSTDYDVAVQFETGVIYASADGISSADFTGDADADVYQVPFLADIIYRFRLGQRLVPFVGVGGGAVYSKVTLDSISDVSVDDDTDQVSPAFQAAGGLKFRLSERSELGEVYKFLAVFADDMDNVLTHSFSLAYLHRF